jgi:hypothetical protein
VDSTPLNISGEYGGLNSAKTKCQAYPIDKKTT